jgi:hypothetical protein
VAAAWLVVHTGFTLRYARPYYVNDVGGIDFNQDDCDVEEVAGAFHGFDGMAPKARVSQSFFTSQCAMLRRAFTPPAA